MNCKKYKTAAKELLKEAEEEIKKGKLRQASEKLWGATAQMVKAYGEKNNISHDGHSQLFQIINKIVKETKDKEIRTLFRVAHDLHINFYENYLPKQQLLEDVESIKNLIKKIEELI